VLFLACEDKQEKDCAGVEGGTAKMDSCQVCDVDTTNDCIKDCADVWGGTATVDNCDDCVGGNTGVEACTEDCNGDFGGTATVDNCDECVGGSTGVDACTEDCAGVWGEDNICGCTDSTASNYNILATLGNDSCYYLPNCKDAYDNDFDGLIDFDDPNCQNNGGGEFPLSSTCADSIDNDEDGLIDSDDPDCYNSGEYSSLDLQILNSSTIFTQPFSPYPPQVSEPFIIFTSHISDQKFCSNYMDSIFVISAVAIDNEEIEKVEFYFNDVLVHVDRHRPYGMELNISYGNHLIKAKSYSLSGNINESTINISIDDMPFIEIQSNEYFNENITVSVNTNSCFDITNIEYFFNDSLVEVSDGILDISTQQIQNEEQFYIYAKLYDEVGNIVISNTVTVIKMSDESCTSCNANFQNCQNDCQGFCHDLCYGDRGRGGDECYEDCLSTYYYGCNESCSLVFDYCGNCCSYLCFSASKECINNNQSSCFECPEGFSASRLNYLFNNATTLDELNFFISNSQYHIFDCAMVICPCDEYNGQCLFNCDE